MTRYVVIGGGAVGATVAAQLHLAGTSAVLVARGAHLAALRAGGLRYVHPTGTTTVPVPVVGGPDELELTGDDVLVVATKAQDVEGVLAAWAWRPVVGRDVVAASVLPIVLLQNGLDSERSALRRFATVFGAVTWSAASHLEPGEVVSPTSPIAAVFWIGAYPSGTHPALERLAADFTAADLAVQVVSDIARWKAGKLLTILPNALTAVYASSPLRDAAAEALRAEAKAVFELIGQPVADFQAESTVDLAGFAVKPIPGKERPGSSTWQSVARGGTVESDYLNGEIVLLARLHGGSAPLNEAVLGRVNQAVAAGVEAGSLGDDDLAALLPSVAAALVS
ncbi:2-dehydropantoate 2-reductase N-terminal domain-containing protein [Umezawaea sp. Da 62-37]|uniref:ketopantoate reductase family protein n=1 Tax=Umezawaea sp. Da 62-37 TaxID=3075927 RepID=UPI0028F73A3B|nr:2-dehydropantoate 2-reductase N-terminal domain-containing protein [Umezawaea sp. Da 62-37]WNV88029.1 2-dehydropantoate 2-reductase N-terminal domain-containing protein [Umezawaea sp. Da 62-37]